MTFVKVITVAAALGIALLIGGGLCAPPAQAGYIVTLTQQGANVVATGSGTIDTTGLSHFTARGQLPCYSRPLEASLPGRQQLC
jgi:hypothetical protein